MLCRPLFSLLFGGAGGTSGQISVSRPCSLLRRDIKFFCPISRLPATEVLVLVDFEATMPDELTVAAGDVVKGVSKAGEEGWLQGELGGKKGIFPANFVKVCPRRRAWQ